MPGIGDLLMLVGKLKGVMDERKARELEEFLKEQQAEQDRLDSEARRAAYDAQRQESIGKLQEQEYETETRRLTGYGSTGRTRSSGGVGATTGSGELSAKEQLEFAQSGVDPAEYQRRARADLERQLAEITSAGPGSGPVAERAYQDVITGRKRQLGSAKVLEGQYGYVGESVRKRQRVDRIAEVRGQLADDLASATSPTGGSGSGMGDLASAETRLDDLVRLEYNPADINRLRERIKVVRSGLIEERQWRAVEYVVNAAKTSPEAGITAARAMISEGRARGYAPEVMEALAVMPKSISALEETKKKDKQTADQQLELLRFVTGLVSKADLPSAFMAQQLSNNIAPYLRLDATSNLLATATSRLPDLQEEARRTEYRDLLTNSTPEQVAMYFAAHPEEIPAALVPVVMATLSDMEKTIEDRARIDIQTGLTREMAIARAKEESLLEVFPNAPREVVRAIALGYDVGDLFGEPEEPVKPWFDQPGETWEAQSRGMRQFITNTALPKDLTDVMDSETYTFQPGKLARLSPKELEESIKIIGKALKLQGIQNFIDNGTLPHTAIQLLATLNNEYANRMIDKDEEKAAQRGIRVRSNDEVSREMFGRSLADIEAAVNQRLGRGGPMGTGVGPMGGMEQGTMLPGTPPSGARQTAPVTPPTSVVPRIPDRDTRIFLDTDATKALIGESRARAESAIARQSTKMGGPEDPKNPLRYVSPPGLMESVVQDVRLFLGEVGISDELIGPMMERVFPPNDRVNMELLQTFRKASTEGDDTLEEFLERNPHFSSSTQLRRSAENASGEYKAGTNIEGGAALSGGPSNVESELVRRTLAIVSQAKASPNNVTFHVGQVLDGVAKDLGVTMRNRDSLVREVMRQWKRR